MTTRVNTSGISADQRRAIFAAARAKGLTTDDIRAMTPKGSISMLSQREAYDVLQRLNKGTAYDRPAPAKQRRPCGVMPIRPSTGIAGLDAGLREELRMLYGWTAQQLEAWLAKKHYRDGRPMDEAQTHRDHLDRIELLKAVLKRGRTAAATKEESCPF